MSSNKTLITALNQVIKALQQPSLAKATLVLGGKAVKAKDVVTILQDAVDAIAAGGAARVTYKQVIAKQEAAKAAALAYVPEIKTYIAAMYGKTSTMYATFGFGPQPLKPTSDVRSAAVAKNRATRIARGTLGKRQRARIKGVVAPASAAPATPASPAGTNGGNGNGGNGNGGNGTPSR